MDEDFQPNRGMWSCFPCLELWKWGRTKLAKNDPEREPLFPSPHTILTAPTKKKRPNLENIHSSQSSFSLPLWQSEPTSPTKSGYFYGIEGLTRNGSSSKLSEEGRERLGSISRAYGGRMQSLHPPPSIPSTPSLPSTPHYTGVGTIMRPLSAINPLSQPSSSASNQNPNSTSTPTTPYRPSVPNLGRSASEPRNLNDLALGGFAPHQIPAFGSISVGRGRGRGRQRSATTSEKLSSPLAIHDGGEGTEKGRGRGRGRGRSPGPSYFNHLAQEEDNSRDDQKNSANTVGIIDGQREAEDGGNFRPMGRSLSHPELIHSQSRSINEGEHQDEDRQAIVEEEVIIKRELGLKGLHSVRGGKRGGKGHKMGGRGGSGSGKRIRSD